MADADPAKNAPSPPVDQAPVKAAPAPVAARKVEPQKEIAFQEHGWKMMTYDCIAPIGVTPDDVVKRDYWAHVSASRLRTMTKIYIMADDRSWYGELIVWQTYTNGAAVSWVSGPHHMTSIPALREESEFEIFDGGLTKAWSVRRKRDGRVFIEGKTSAQEADAALRDWLKAQGSRRAA